MIPMHQQNQISGRYSNSSVAYPNHQLHHSQPQQHYHRQNQHHQHYPSSGWAYAPSSIITPSNITPAALHGRYPYPATAGLMTMMTSTNRSLPHRVGPATSLSASSGFVAISPSMAPRYVVANSTPMAAAATDNPASSTATSSFPTSTSTSSSTAAPTPTPSIPVSSTKGNQKEEYEAAEVLLGLTTREDKDLNGDLSSQSSVRKNSDASSWTAAASQHKKTLSLGHVTDESSIGTTSPTPITTVCTEDPSNWFTGSVSLSLPEDDDVLSPLHCFMRKYCVETFSASAADVATPRYGKSHGFKVEVGQVGIRCIYCKDLPVGKRPERAVCYPSSLRNIYHSIETWQRRHSLVCTHISPWVRKSIEELMESSKTRAGGRRQYWEDSAKRLGMVDTSRGVRFIRPPRDLGPSQKQPSVASEASASARLSIGLPVVLQEDKELVTDYLYLLMEQMQTCYFTEEDRTGGRSKIKDISLNFPGYKCRHCHGRAGFGRYFPSSVAALSLANSDRNVFNHLQKCRRCPSKIKKELIRLSKEQAQSKNRRGLRKMFFGRIWERMHSTPAEAL